MRENAEEIIKRMEAGSPKEIVLPQSGATEVFRLLENRPELNEKWDFGRLPGAGGFLVFHLKEKIPTDNNYEKPRIRVPGDDRPIGEFASELGDVFSMENCIFYSPLLKQVVRVDLLKPTKNSSDNYYVEGFQVMKGTEFITLLETYFDLGSYKKGLLGEFFVRRSVTESAANIVLASVDQFKAKLPMLERIYTVPRPVILRGELLFPQRGYDDRLRSWLSHDAPQIDLTMPLDKARELLEWVFGEFCFVGPQDKSNAIAALLTPFCRGLYSRETVRTPAFVYKANRERAGKDYCAGITGIVYEGAPIENPPISTDHETHDDELRKKIFSTVKEGRARMHSSNNKGFLNSPELEAAITNEFITDRQLGASSTLTIPNRLEISISANMGITYTPDFAARCCFVNLSFSEEDPNARQFKTPNLHGWVREHRSEVLSALYALVREWFDSGRKPGSGTFTSFPEWADVVGGIMENAGLGLPLQNDTADDIGGDKETKDMKALFERIYAKWPEKYMNKQAIMVELANQESDFYGLFGWLQWGDPQKEPAARMKFGRLLNKFKGRVFSNIRMDAFEDATHPIRDQYIWTKKGFKGQANLDTLGALDSFFTISTILLFLYI